MLLLIGRAGMRESAHVVLSCARMLLLLLVTKTGLSRLLLMANPRKLLLLQQQMGSRRGSEEWDTGVGEGLRKLCSLAKWRRPSVRILIHDSN